ncbi:MAG: YetF domain-containing protein [Sediminicola sp.]|tara:strand:- start:116778 stop:117305 length:528 start_codon:yes stop_codon:yes gene_type:complete
MEKIWFDNWESIVRTICLTILGYCAMVVLLRVSGKRTLSKMNAFDFIVTIALGSSLSSVSLNKDISLADGVTAFILLMACQFVLTWLSVRVKAIKNLITSSPTLIFYKGNFLEKVLKKERITVDEIYSASRKQGISTLDDIDMIILETTGDITLIQDKISGRKTTYKDVKMHRTT